MKDIVEMFLNKIKSNILLINWTILNLD